MSRTLSRLALVMVLMFGGVTQLMAAAGDLDCTFGTGGFARSNFGGSELATEVDIQSDGKILAFGSGILARYMPNGALDTSFGTNGSISVAGGLRAKLDSTGRIVVAGRSGNQNLVYRFTSSGAPDPTFNGSGSTVFSFATTGNDLLMTLEIDHLDRIVVGGTNDTTAQTGSAVFAVARLTTAGALDTTFNLTGVYVGPRIAGFDDQMWAVTVQSDNKVIAATARWPVGGWRNHKLYRFNTNGTPDLSFGNGGNFEWNASGTGSGVFSDDFPLAVEVDSLGRIVTVGSTPALLPSSNLVISRLNSFGALDGSFATGGTLITEFADGAQDVIETDGLAIQPDNKIIVTGFVTFRMGILRLTASGALDPTFAGGAGRRVHQVSSQDRGFSAALQADGRIVMAGSGGFSGGQGHDFVILRYQNDNDNYNPTTTTITSDTPDPSMPLQAVTVQWSVTSTAGTPTGTVTVSDGPDQCTAAVSAGSCSITLTNIGIRTLTAKYNGDGIFCPSSATTSHTIQAASTTTTIVSDAPDPSSVGSPVTVTVNVTSSNGTPTGTVNVSDGAGATCSFALVNGTGNCSFTPTVSGTRNITASFAGSGGYANSSRTAAHTFNKITTTTTITSRTPNPSTYGEAVTVAVSVTAADGSTPTGTVAVFNGANSCVVTLASGAGQCAMTPASAGMPAINATYNGNATYNTSSTGVGHTVNRAASSASITANTPNPSLVGQPVTVNVTVSSVAGVPTGSVIVSDGPGATCVATLSNGAGTCSLTFASAGARTITAAYGGDANFLASNATTSQTVNRVDSSLTIVSDTPDPSVIGSAVEVAVTVSGPNGTPSGNVTIHDGQGGTCVITLANGAGNCSFTATVAGSRNISASYGGDASFGASSATTPHEFQKAGTSTVIVSHAPNASMVGQPVTVAVTVSSAAGMPQGTVAVNDGQGGTCVITLLSGAGNCSFAGAIAGSRDITAAYSGDANFNASSASDQHAFVPADSTVTIVSHDPNPSVIGQPVTVSVTVSGVVGPAQGTVSIGDLQGGNCSATLVSGTATCSFTPLVAGTRDIAAGYLGDGLYYSSSSATVRHEFQRASTVAQFLADTPDPSAPGSSVSVTVKITSASGVPTGSVLIADGSASCTASLTAGTGSCSLTLTTIGTRTLTATYSGDANHLPSSATESHVVADNVAPVFVSVTPSLTMLWPPNHKMVPVSFVARVTDNVDANPQVRIINVLVSQAANGTGDGNTSQDWQITGPLTVQLRAERSGKDGDRIYTVVLEAKDAAGNTSRYNVNIRAPQHQ